jgi:hypothetical protein
MGPPHGLVLHIEAVGESLCLAELVGYLITGFIIAPVSTKWLTMQATVNPLTTVSNIVPGECAELVRVR